MNGLLVYNLDSLVEKTPEGKKNRLWIILNIVHSLRKSLRLERDGRFSVYSIIPHVTIFCGISVHKPFNASQHYTWEYLNSGCKVCSTYCL